MSVFPPTETLSLSRSLSLSLSHTHTHTQTHTHTHTHTRCIKLLPSILLPDTRGTQTAECRISPRWHLHLFYPYDTQAEAAALSLPVHPHVIDRRTYLGRENVISLKSLIEGQRTYSKGSIRMKIYRINQI